MAQRGELFSTRANTPKRTYFFNVKENRTGDRFLNLVESRKRDSTREGAGFERQSLIVFDEDLDQFVAALDQAVDFLRTFRKRDSR
jgi:hypothetical protein